MSLVIPDAESEDFVFAGRETIENVGFVIDADNDGTSDDGDYYAMKHAVLINGNYTSTFEYPGDFNQISASGTITMQIEGANADHNGATLMHGAAGIPLDQHERSGDNTVISCDLVVVTIPYPGNGGWYTNRLDLSISGDRTVTFEY